MFHDWRFLIILYLILTGIWGVVAKVSAGAIEYVPVARVTNISDAILELKKSNIWVTGIDTGGQQDYTRVDYSGPAAIAIGSEGKGLSELVKKRCDFVACIPMRGRITSLNASVAAALVMYEAMRQRARPGAPGREDPSPKPQVPASP